MQTPDNTLETLRQQYQSLKDTASNTCKITPEMIERATSGHVSVINKTMIKITVCGVIALVLWPIVSVMLELSWTFTIVTLLFVLLELGFKWWNLKDITDPSDCTTNLLDLADSSLKAKRRSLIQFYTGSSFLVLWFVYFCYELSLHLPADEVRNMIIVCSISGVIGFFIGMRYSRRIRRELSMIHAQISDILSTDIEN